MPITPCAKVRGHLVAREDDVVIKIVNHMFLDFGKKTIHFLDHGP